MRLRATVADIFLGHAHVTDITTWTFLVPESLAHGPLPTVDLYLGAFPLVTCSKDNSATLPPTVRHDQRDRRVWSRLLNGE